MPDQQLHNANEVSVAILSDLHVYDSVSDGETIPSHLSTQTSENDALRHPISGLKRLIENRLSADVLLCPGDLANKANVAGTKYAWEQLSGVFTALNASIFAATAGNHDLDSRYKIGSVDPRQTLQALLPKFPLRDDLRNLEYWGRHFSIIEHTDIRIVVLNSCAYHGLADGETPHGRVSEQTVQDLHDELLKRTPAAISIMLCHHHPQQHTELELGDYDTMKNGQMLLDMLGSGEVGEWLVVHGHKHHAKLSFASGGNCAPIIFSAGSLCAVPYPQLSTVSRNQFYILKFPIDACQTRGLVGTFEAWDWAYGTGWRAVSPRGANLPNIGGFGFRGKLSQLAADVFKVLKPNMPTKWDDLLKQVPDLAYLLPTDDVIFRTVARTKFNVGVFEDDTGNRLVTRP